MTFGLSRSSATGARKVQSEGDCAMSSWPLNRSREVGQIDAVLYNEERGAQCDVEASGL